MDKYIVITGASSGIGMAAAKAFAAHGFDLILIARSIKLLEKLKGEVETKFGIKAVIKTADLSHTDEVYRVYSELSEYYIFGLDKQCGIWRLLIGGGAGSAKSGADDSGRCYCANDFQHTLCA